MPPKTKSGLIRVLPVLLGLSGALPAVATEYQAADYLPLAVGNSWTYEHDHADRDADYSQWSTYTAQHPKTPQFTIEVVRTEALDGQTYYVISDMPANWPPAPRVSSRAKLRGSNQRQQWRSCFSGQCKSGRYRPMQKRPGAKAQ